MRLAIRLTKICKHPKKWCMFCKDRKTNCSFEGYEEDFAAPSYSLVENGKRLMKKYGYFHITSVTRDDIHSWIVDNKDHPLLEVGEADRILKGIDSIPDDRMENLASQMADDYCEQLFWVSIEVLGLELAKEFAPKEAI